MQFGRYQILEKLGEGGMGVVYRAVALGVDGFKKPVVIKRIHSHLAQRKDLLRRFINEAKIAMSMSHNNVVQVLDLGKMGQEYFIALEYVNGRDLRTVIKRCQKNKEWLPTEISLYIVTEILRGLDYAHRRTDADGKPLSIVHRDVTPANILCSFEGEVKLTDFGIARALAWSGSTQVGSIRGSVHFMSPEQAWGEGVDQRSDLFSVGAILYLLLCEATPFDGRDFEEVAKRVRAGEFLQPQARGVDLPDELATILLTALSREADDRYSTAASMLMAVENYQRSIEHATSSDFQAFVQRLFEAEIEESSVGRTDGDGLVGSEITISGAKVGLPGVSVYSLSMDNTAVTQPSSPRSRRNLEPIRDDPATGSGPAPALDEVDLPRGPAMSRWPLLITALAVLMVIGGGLAYYLLPAGAGDAARGVLVVRTQPPGATIRINGKPAPQPSPVVISDLHQGESYLVEADLKDHTGPPRRVKLTSAALTTTIEMWRVSGRLKINSNPDRSDVTINNKPRGKTPLDVSVPLKRPAEIEVTHPGHRPWVKQVTLTRERPELELEANLPPKK